MSTRTRPARGLVTARWGWQPDAWLQQGLPTWPRGRAPRALVTSQQLRAAGLERGDVAAAGQLHRPGPTRGSRGVVALWDLDEVRAHTALTHYRAQHRAPHQDTGAHRMSYEPLVDAWHDSREDRTPLRPGGRGRGRWASLEHAVAGGHRRGDGAGIADTTPGRGRGPVCVDDAEIQDAEPPDTYVTDFVDVDAPEEDLDQEHGDRRSGGRGELGLEDEIDDEMNEEIDPEAGDDDEEPAA